MLTNLQSLCFILPVLPGLANAGLVPQKRADVCGQKGDDRGNGNYDYDGSGKYSTLATCSARCLADTKCKSFSFGGKDCLLFSVAVTGNFDAGAADYIFYDRSCVSSSSPAPATSSTTTTSSSSKTSSSTSSSTTSKSSTSLTVKPTTSSVKPSTTPAATPSTTSSTSPGVTVPAGCNVPTKLSMTSFTWFNSTHNLDCANPNYPSDATVCWNSASNTLCAQGSDGCTCTPYCYTGLPSAAYQPLGYGPPDTISIGFDGRSCSAANPQSIRRYEVGGGHFDCGSAADYVGFTGDSNKDTGNTGSVYYNNYGATCSNGAVPRYEGTFPLTCTHDAGNNATCTVPVPVELTLVRVG